MMWGGSDEGCALMTVVSELFLLLSMLYCLDVCL